MEKMANPARIDLLQPLVRYRQLIIIVSLLFAFVTVAYRILTPQLYEATVVLAPTRSDDNMSNRLGQLSSLASFAGISVGQRDTVPNFDRFMFLVFSPDLGTWQIKHRNILPILFPERWDADKKTWRQPSGLSGFLNMLARPITDSPPLDGPDAYSIAAAYKADLAASRVVGTSTTSEQTGMMQLTYTARTPEQAEAVLNFVVMDANEILREQAAQRASTQAEYLKEKLATISIQDYRDTLEKLLAQQEQTLMLTNSRLPFAAEPVSIESVPPKRVPKRILLFGFMAGALGFCFSYFFSIVRYNRDLQSGIQDIPKLENRQSRRRSRLTSFAGTILGI